MFGIVTANWKELSKAQQARYGGVYCGICRNIHEEASQLSRMCLSYDMAFLAMILMSLYEPEERQGNHVCLMHPGKGRYWVENEFTRYAADMNVALAYYKSLDDAADEHKLSAKWMAGILGKFLPDIREKYPRQCKAMEESLNRLSRLEKENCPNPDLPANAFGDLMAELFVYREDLWAPCLRSMGRYLGRFIYLQDAAADYSRDRRSGSYNPFVAAGQGEDPEGWEKILVLAMAKATEYFEKLPLVQDKDILDNILYSGVWCSSHRGSGKEAAK